MAEVRRRPDSCAQRKASDLEGHGYGRAETHAARADPTCRAVGVRLARDYRGHRQEVPPRPLQQDGGELGPLRPSSAHTARRTARWPG